MLRLLCYLKSYILYFCLINKGSTNSWSHLFICIYMYIAILIVMVLVYTVYPLYGDEIDLEITITMQNADLWLSAGECG